MVVDDWLPWAIFVGIVVAVLAVDLLVLHRNAHEVTLREAAFLMAGWVTLAIAFTPFVWLWRGGESAGEYLAGYVLEMSISIDTVFVFAMIFMYFRVPPLYRHRVLFWGVLGALVFRAVFIVLGVELLERFHWAIYVFGVFLVFTGIKMARSDAHEINPERNPILRLMKRFVPMTTAYDGQRFLVRSGGRWMATPLVAVLVVVESMDVMFALDSIPAVFAVTQDPFVVYTSNAFAMLGLRTLYFLMAPLVERLGFVRVALAALLVLAGVKMLLSDVFHVPIWVVLLVIAAVAGVVIHEMRMTLGELKTLVLSHRGVNDRQRKIVSRLFDVQERKLRDVIIPRARVVTLAGDLPVKAALSQLVGSGHSRAPVCGSNPDEVAGTVHLIDLIRAEERGSVREHARAPVLLPESTSVLDALAQLQQTQQTMALVVEEHGGFEGIVTVEDLVEELVGEVWDEFDLPPKAIEEDASHGFVVPGNMPIHKLAQYDVELPRSARWSTIAGLVLYSLQRIPTEGDATELNGWRLEVEAMEGLRVSRVRLTRIQPDEVYDQGPDQPETPRDLSP
jgi:tellurite resistance protein TerC